MAEEIRLRLVVDAAAGTNTIKALEKQVEELKKKLAEARSSGPLVPSQSASIASLDGLKQRLAELKKALGAAELGSDSFRSIAAEARTVESQIRAATESARGIAPAVAPAAGSMAELRQRVKDATAEIQNVAVGSARFRELEEEIFAANSQLKNLRNDLKGVTDEKLVGSFVAIGKGIAGTFAAASSAASLLARDSAAAEEVTRAAAKAQEYLALVVGLANVQLAVEETREARLVVVQRARAAATTVVTAAQSALNAVMRANPLALVVLAVAGLVAGMIALRDRLKFVSDAFSFMGRVASALLAPLRAVASALGLVGESESARFKRRAEELAHETDAIREKYETEIEMAKAAGEEVAGLEIDKQLAVARSVQRQLAEYELLRQRVGTLNKEQLDDYRQLQDDLAEAQRAAAVLRVQEERRTAGELLDAQEELEDARLGLMGEGFERELAQSRADHERRKKEVQRQIDEIERLKATSGVDNAQLETQRALRNLLLAEDEKFERDRAKLSRDYAAREAKAKLQLAVESATEGSREQLRAKIALLEFERREVMREEGKTASERLLAARKVEEEIAGIRLQLGEQERTQGFERQKRLLEAELGLYAGDASKQYEVRTRLAQLEFKYKQDLLAAELRSMRDLGATKEEIDTRQQETQRANSKELLNAMTEYEKRKAEIMLGSTKTQQEAAQRASTIERLQLEARLRDVSLTAEERLRLEQQLTDNLLREENRRGVDALIELARAAEERRRQLQDDRAKEEQDTNVAYNLGVLSKEEYMQRRADIDTKYREFFAEEEKRANEERLIAEEESKNKEVAIVEDGEARKRAARARGLANAKLLLDAGAKTFAEAQAAELEAAGENEKKKKDIRKRYALFELALSLAQIYIDTQQAVIAVSKDLPPLLADVYRGILIAQGVAAAANVTAQKARILALAKGGVVQGPGGPEEDRVPAMLSAGESVINARSTRMFYPLLSAINEAGGGRAFDNAPRYRLAEGGVVLPGAAPAGPSEDVLQLRAAVAELAESLRAESAKQVVVVESDISSTQRKVRVIETKARII